MGVPDSEVGYTSPTARRGDHESSYEHVVALEGRGGGNKQTTMQGQTQIKWIGLFVYICSNLAYYPLHLKVKENPRKYEILASYGSEICVFWD